MQTAAGLIGRIVKFSACMERGEHETFRADTLLVHANGNSASIIRNRRGTVRFQSHLNAITIPRKMLVHGVVQDLVDQVIQTLGGHAANIHSRALTDRLQSFQNGDAGSVVLICNSHFSEIPPNNPI